jgi:hypothetical protein
VIKPKRCLRVVQRDPSDNKFIECAVAGRARVIISGANGLLSLGRYRHIRIQAPAQFFADNPDLGDFYRPRDKTISEPNFAAADAPSFLHASSKTA